MNSTLEKTYSDKLSEYSFQLIKIKKQNRTTSFLRLLIFITATVVSITFKENGAYFITGSIIMALVPFLYLIKRNVQYKSKIKHLEALIRINKNELEALKGNISVFYPGKEFIDPSHAFSYDLDIFGQGSIFQQINRTCTGGGAMALSESLKSPLMDRKKISERQNASKELSQMLIWRQNFKATGEIALEAEDNSNEKVKWFQSNNKKYSNDTRFHNEIINWLKSPFYFLHKKSINLMLYFLPAISVILLGLLIAGLIPAIIFIFYGLLQLSIAGGYMKKVGEIHGVIGRKTELLNKYEQLLLCIEEQGFKDDYLNRRKGQLSNANSKASKSLEKLKSLVRALDNRFNLLFAFIANAYVSWDIQVVYRMEKWRKENAEKLPEWLEVIYEFDFLSSFANYSYNKPEFTIPEIKEGEFYLEMEQAGHPLIESEVRVDNDLIIKGHKQLLTITGANMAGKSTFLRTVGVNMILAMAGSVVCAKKLVISPIQMHTSVRTSDSVQKSESYFFAELKRLKQIIDRMQNGENLFVIIDEMLRGTNSKDKHHGSEALMEQLIRLNGSGLIATHDIALGSLAQKFPDNVRNYRFEVEIENNELHFDYKLKTGVSQNLNATFLMKKMGITV